MTTSVPANLDIKGMESRHVHVCSPISGIWVSSIKIDSKEERLLARLPSNVKSRAWTSSNFASRLVG